jgi:UDP-glucose 4-epimerase
VFKIYGNDYPTKDGTCVRDFIDMRDLASAHYKALEYVDKMDCNFDVINIGTQVGTSVKELVESFILVKGVNLLYEYVDKRQGDASECYADIDNAKNKLDWRPMYTLNQSIQSIDVNLH